MRISTSMMFQQGLNSLNSQQSAFLKVGQQLAANKRVVVASDDPLAMSKATTIGQSKAVAGQFEDARVSARNSLSQVESVLNSVGESITSAKVLLIQGSTGTLSDANRQSIASELKGILQTVMGQANAADGNGRYLFGGYQDSSPPYELDPSGSIQYRGDMGESSQRVDNGRVMQVGTPGELIFNAASGLGVMSARAGDDNEGTVRFTTPVIDDNNAPDFRDAFDITFSDVGGVPHYSINGEPEEPYVSGDKIIRSGVSVVLSGEPVPGDTIRVAGGQDGQNNLFKSLQDAIDVLDNPVASDADKARLANTLNSVSNELTSAFDNVMTVRASAGARLNELDVIDNVGANRTMNYTQSISELIDLDMNAAISEYTLRQVGLQAAQKSFVDIQGLSLFNLMR